MNEEVFSTEPSSISEMADRWGVPSHQIVYVVRSRGIAYVRRAGTVRLFNVEQQKEIHSHLRKHLVSEGSVEIHPILPGLQEEEALEMETQRQELEALKARVVILERLLADLLERK